MPLFSGSFLHRSQRLPSIIVMVACTYVLNQSQSVSALETPSKTSSIDMISMSEYVRDMFGFRLWKEGVMEEGE
nr:hypothetical protein [Tanacetum cinerariifolium]